MQHIRGSRLHQEQLVVDALRVTLGRLAPARKVITVSF